MDITKNVLLFSAMGKEGLEVWLTAPCSKNKNVSQLLSQGNA